MTQPPLVSIIINNYNYGNFLSQAIDSALQQTYTPTEVIVVDDGSTDCSQEVIAGYGGKVLAVLKENGGQASALNAGFACSYGDVIIFLDADDILLPDITGQVVAAFQANPDVTKVQFRLAVIDERGNRTGTIQPPAKKPMPGGDLRNQILTFPDDISWQPTSGNALRASMLYQILPIPEEPYRLCADYYVSNLSALFGVVVSLDQVGGLLRVHGANFHNTSEVSAPRSRDILIRTMHTHGYIRKFAEASGLDGFTANEADVLSVTFLAHRMVSLKLDPHLHPIKSDTVLKLLIRGAQASFGRFDLPLRNRFLYMLWFATIALSPQPLVRNLARMFFYPETRGWLNRFI